MEYPRSEKSGKQLDKSLATTEERCEKQIDVCGSSTTNGEGANEAVHVGDPRQIKHTARRVHTSLLRSAYATPTASHTGVLH